MAKRHTAPEHKLHTRVRDIGPILASGQGLARVPSKNSDPFRLPRRPEEPSPRVYTGAALLGLSSQMIIENGVRIIAHFIPQSQRLIEYFEAAGSATEVDMREYWRLIRERRALLAEIEWDEQRRLFPGWTPPASVSPFGPETTRFRTFDPTPAFEFVAGPIRHIGR